jgi:hypothetical protein
MTDVSKSARLLRRPIVVLGVPRSGTTLLRVLVGLHPQVVSLPETPWITGGYGPTSLKTLAKELTEDVTGPVRSLVGVDRARVVAAIRGLIAELIEPALEGAAERLVLKTPDDVPHVAFLHELFPHAHFLHICRDGRDVAASTAHTADLGPRITGFGPRTALNAMWRWVAWESELRAVTASLGDASLFLRYEELVREPRATLERVCAFLDLPFAAAMLNYDLRDEKLPAFEPGSRNVAQRNGIEPENVGRWRERLTRPEMVAIDRVFAEDLSRLGYAPCFAGGSPAPSRWERARDRLSGPLAERAHRRLRAWMARRG